MTRTSEFEPNVALQRAVDLFWDKGYFDTSMVDLVNAMGVARYGLYGTWGNKHELFKAVLEKYAEQQINMMKGDLHGPDGSLPEILQFFKHRIDMYEDNKQLGCLVCNTAIEIAPHDEEVAELLRKIFARLTGIFRKALGNAVEKGELSTTHDLDALAEYLTGIMRSIAVMSRTGYTRKDVQNHLKIALSVLV